MPRSVVEPPSVTPGKMPETLPHEIAGNHSFLLQSMMEMQRAFGRVEGAVEGLQVQVREQNATLEWLKKVVWAASAVVVVGGAILSFIVSARFDEIVKALQSSDPPPATASTSAKTPTVTAKPTTPAAK